MPTGIYETLSNNFKLLVKKFTYDKSEIDTKLTEKAGTNVASASSNGLMSSTDKNKLDGIQEGANKTIIDDSLSESSTNPVQNKIIKTALDSKSDIGHDHDGRYYTESEIDTKVGVLQTAIDSLVGFTASVVEELPSSGEKGVMYLVLTEDGGVEQDIYNEYIWVDNKFEKIGNTAVEVDLSGYATKEYVTTQLSDYTTNSNLQTELNKKANTVHTHAISDVTDLQTSLDAKLTKTDLATEWNAILEQMLQE